MPDTKTIEDHKCIIINITKDELVVLDAYTDATATKPEVMYEQTLKSLGTIPATDSNDHTTHTVLLEDYHKDANGNQAYNKIYELIIARADNLFPVLSAVAIQQRVTLSNGTIYKNYKPVTIVPDAPGNMSLAENFIQTIGALPTSDLSKNYVDALNDAGAGSTSDSSVDERVNTYFKEKTKEYQTLTLDMLASVQTYYSQYPYVWADYKGSKTYYLYSSDGNKVTYAGSVDLSFPATTMSGTDKSLPGAALTYTDASGNQKKLCYSDGLFIDDLTKDEPAISLKGLFVLKSTLTKNPADNTVISVLSGTVNSNEKVMGYPEKLKQDDDGSGSWSGLYILLHPKDAMGWLNLFMTVMGVVMGLEVLLKGAKSLKDRFTRKKAEDDGNEPTSSEIDQLRSEIKEMKTQMLESNQQLLDKIDAGQKVPEDVGAAINDLQQQTGNRLNEDQRTTLEESLDNDETLMEEAAQFQVDDTMENTENSIANDRDKLDSATPEELPGIVSEVKADVAKINADVTVEVQNASENFAGDEVKIVEQAQEDLKKAEETAEAIEESSKSTEEGRTPEEIEFEPKMEIG